MPSPNRRPKLACRFYRTDAGNEPVREWLKALDGETRKQIGEDIGTVQWTWPVGKPLVDGFGGGLHEVRTTHDKNEYRILFCVENDQMILLHALHKKTKKTPPAEVALARRRQRG
jgi:phage-related protein